MALCPSPCPIRPGSVPHRCLSVILLYSFGLCPPGRERKKSVGTDLRFVLLPLLNLPFCKERTHVVIWASVTSPHSLLHSWPRGFSPRGPRQPPFPSQSSPGEDALAVVVENCPAKKTVAGKKAEGEVGEKMG
jgi:hypothetical protein